MQNMLSLGEDQASASASAPGGRGGVGGDQVTTAGHDPGQHGSLLRCLMGQSFSTSGKCS